MLSCADKARLSLFTTGRLFPVDVLFCAKLFFLLCVFTEICVKVLCPVWPYARTQEFYTKYIPQYLFKGQAVPLVHGEQETGQHQGDHQEHRPGIADSRTAAQVNGNPNSRRASKTDKLALRQIERQLVFYFRQIVWYVYIRQSENLLA